MTTKLQRAELSPFGERLETLRDENGVSFNDLADDLGINRTTLFKWRSKEYPCLEQIKTFVAIADMFDVSLDWLVGRSDVRERAGQRMAPCRECARLRGRLEEILEGSRGPAEAKEIRERTRLVREAKLAKYASGGRDGLKPEEIDAVLQGATS